MKKTISFYTLGCRSNQAETAALENLCQSHGFKVLHENKKSDIAVINTCTVTEKGDLDTRRLVSKIRRFDKKTKIALIGCQAQTQSEELKKEFSVQWIIGNAKKMELPQILLSKPSESTKIIVPEIERKSFVMPSIASTLKRTRANIKIQDGCDNFCSYCEVSHARGPGRSREFDDIVNEAKSLAQAEYKELILTGINIGSYNFRNKNISDVLRKIVSINKIERIRISSIEPNNILKDLILLMASNRKICRHLHIPIQSACDEILHSMKRRYQQADLDLFFEYATQNIHDLCIGADVIVGFPGETNDFFDQTYDFLKSSPLAYFHIFSYSNRKLAESKDFPGQINKPIIAKRSKILRDLSQKKKNVFMSKFLDTSQKVLFEKKKDGLWDGLTDNYMRVFVSSDEDLQNQICQVYFKSICSKGIMGELE